jgi:FKBP12-rapamycin complex-associated protein
MSYVNMLHLTQSASPEARRNAEVGLARVLRTWRLRFDQLPPVPDVLHEVLCIRSLVLDSNALLPEWLSVISCAIASDRLELVASTLAHLKQTGVAGPAIDFWDARLLWAQGRRSEAVAALAPVAPKLGDERGELFLGLWLMETGKLNEARSHIQKATQLNGKNVSVWNQWSIVNYRLADQLEGALADSLEGAMEALLLSADDPMAFTFRILSILFRRGSEAIYARFRSKLGAIPVHVWISVLPQLIARSHAPNISGVLHELIVAIGREHPLPVLYSLMVPVKSDIVERRAAASRVIDELKSVYPVIISEMQTLATELIRSAVTWWELWHTNLDEASRVFIVQNDVEQMLALLAQAHETVSHAPETFYEAMFIRQFGRQVALAEHWTGRFRETQREEYLNQAWAIYVPLFRQMKTYLAEVQRIDLADASPQMGAMRNMEVVVPGTYDYREQLVRIHSIQGDMSVMRSKQRPRRMAITGSDGVKYNFLLKAHEDTRLDERVMQFFALVNTFLHHSTIPLKTKMAITTYKVIPLTGSVGLIGWVPDCSTVFEIVQDFREKSGVTVDAEWQRIYAVAPKFEVMPDQQKVKPFLHGLKATAGTDLMQILLSRADDSNHWIERRTTYSASLAMTSIAGYILGLGDRHLSNIMMKRKSAKLVHIDFGDCFEVAMHRNKFPEQVPFRLTRILENALEVSKIEGTFRSCCENVMTLVHTNADQLVGLLEVFIYDPLLQWTTTSQSEAIVKRISDKLKGCDFETGKVYTVQEQVAKLIDQARSPENLSRMFRGWLPWW